MIRDIFYNLGVIIELTFLAFQKYYLILLMVFGGVVLILRRKKFATMIDKENNFDRKVLLYFSIPFIMIALPFGVLYKVIQSYRV